MAYIVATKKNNMVIEVEGTNIYLKNLDPGKGTSWNADDSVWINQFYIESLAQEALSKKVIPFCAVVLTLPSDPDSISSPGHTILCMMTLLEFIMNSFFLYTGTQLWKFELTPIPGVFYITNTASGQVLSVPSPVENHTYATLASKKDGYDSEQLWKFISSADGVNLLIQNYSLDGNGHVLDCGSGPNSQVFVWSRVDNDNQKYYINI